ncbi:hypothetical protein M1523_00705 [Patescibacteria group bacterium]|nr:hypothetical protein [Patescibacteria group bacterium]MCL5091676.1 hypothetical protein [Patescibacteria group bacterium]
MKKFVKENQDKTLGQLEQLARSLEMEIVKMALAAKSAPAKDTNLLRKKKKNLAVIKTLITAKKDIS